MKRAVSILTTPGSPFAASMLRDIENNAPIEADHVIGDLIARGQTKNSNSPLLRIAYTHLKAYEARLAREAATVKGGIAGTFRVLTHCFDRKSSQ